MKNLKKKKRDKNNKNPFHKNTKINDHTKHNIRQNREIVARKMKSKHIWMGNK